jgi:calcineurin-like phosphoesterase family protein
MDFFTADTHFGHVNMLRYCNRPFTSVEEMDAALIARWNRRGGPQ